MKAWALKSSVNYGFYRIFLISDKPTGCWIKNPGDTIVRVRITEIKPRKRKGKI